ncbi:uncharacterized protein LOC130961590 [Arachis stenosperma]|uniref:uncharacterized protein LOC130961590 n=1 Tax=Arachis stenosperma TaxID=217475 RepID=UPI0025AC5FD3|nr:uncharacterized protein LOC130961590 [Arachis stenosperma]XP_057743531.1 uncharacterized protein LOC130961590 [Arachis stenosperma]
MAKKSQRRSIRYEKDKSGCMWGFISMFDFRHGHSTRKLIADRRRSNKHVIGGVPSKNKFEMLSDLDEVSHGNFDTVESKRPTVKTGAVKHSVKKLIEEEMFIDQTTEKDVYNAKVEPNGSRLRCEVPQQTDYKRKKKSSSKSCDMDIDYLNLDATMKSKYLHNQHSRRQSKDDLDLDNIIEEFCHFKESCSVKHGNDRGVHSQSNQKHAISENIAREVIHEFVNQMILNGKDLAEARKYLHSHELMEALQFISSDKELFLALLQNPNSLLLKCIQEFAKSHGRDNNEYSSVTCSNFTEQDLGNEEQTRETVNHKKHNFFRKKTKSQPKNPTNENGKTETSNRIVILKPGSMGLQSSETRNNIASSLQSHDTAKHSSPSARGSSHFSLTDLKNKLKHAMGREKHASPEGISKRYPAECQRPSNKAILKDNVGMRSPNKDHFFLEKIARPTKLKDPELIVEQESGSYKKKRASHLYTEAKKHLSEMIGSGDENMDMSSRQISKTLGRILSLPDYNFSPFGSPSRCWEQHFLTEQTRFSTSDKTWEAYDNMSPKQATFVNNLAQETDNPEKQSTICDRSSNNLVREIKLESNFPDELSHVDKAEGYCAVKDEIVVEGDVESEKEINILESFSEPIRLSIRNEDQSCDILEITEDGIGENQQSTPPSSSHSSFTKKTEELESGAEMCGRPSPVSVLDTPFIEDEISPGYSEYQPIQVAVQPLNIEFEEQDYSPVNQIQKGKYCLEENELIYKYIKAVLQASELTMDQLLMKCHSSDKILDPSLFDQEELPANQLCHDQKLLYDCINEVLMEVCWHYFAVSPFVSFVKNLSIRPSPNMKVVIVKVWEAMCWHFLPLPPPRTLDKIVRKDMEKSSIWMDLRFDAEAVGFEMGEIILAELMEDTILSCTYLD